MFGVLILWILAGVILIYDMNSQIEQLSVFAQVMVMLLLTVFAPVIFITGFVEDLIEWIAGEDVFDDDG